MNKQKCFLVCNAHLDPVWLWHWEDGLAETISTFRVAADFCDKHPEFVFNHNESVLYEWIERNDPDLFKRIKKLVKKGQWHIAGGCYLQPDLIAASGESLIRQYLLGRRYLSEKFGVEPSVAYNFDPFGHPQGFIQILQGCGFSAYVFCRPYRSELDLPVGSFKWKHRSGAEVAARRSDDHYLSNGEIREMMMNDRFPDHYSEEGDFMFLWGIGNHGGGASREEYKQLKLMEKDWPDVEFIESTPEAFFEHTLKSRKKLPVVKGDIKPTFEGCYTSMLQIKQRHREMENLMCLTERIAAMAWWRGQSKYPAKDIEVAWKDILFAEFHDILPGSAVPSVEQDSLNLLGHCEEILRRKKAELIISVLKDEPLAERNNAPIFVFNPHGWPVTQEVEVEYQLDQMYSADSVVPRLTCEGKRVQVQVEKPEHNLLNWDWRLKICFVATIPPMSYKRYDADYKVLPEEKIEPWVTPKLPTGGKLKIDAGKMQVEINTKTGMIDSVKYEEKSVLMKDSFRPLVMKDIKHSWTTLCEWADPESEFKRATRQQAARIMGSGTKGKSPVNIIEDGPVRMKVEVILVSGDSYIVQHYVISKKRPVITLDQTIFWAEHDRMLKLSVNHNRSMNMIDAEKCYSIDDETEKGRVRGREKDFQKFLRLHAGKSGVPALGVVSYGTHGYSQKNGNLRLSVLRSASYATWEYGTDMPRFKERYMPRLDQGVRKCRFTFVFGKESSNSSRMTRAAYEANVPLHPFVYFPTKRVRKKKVCLPFVDISSRNVQLTAVKRAEDGDDLVLRFWETAGRKTRFKFAVEKKSFSVDIGAHCIATWRLSRAGKLKKVDLLERGDLESGSLQY